MIRGRPLQALVAGSLLAVAVVLGGVVVLTQHDSEHVSSTSTLASPAPPGSPESHAPYKAEPEVEDVARRFLPGYLVYVYGQGTVEAIDGASEQLLEDLTANPPRRLPHLRQRDPEVVELRSYPPGPARVRLVAIVDDGAARYPLSIIAARTDDGWQVTRVPNEE